MIISRTEPVYKTTPGGNLDESPALVHVTVRPLDRVKSVHAVVPGKEVGVLLPELKPLDNVTENLFVADNLGPGVEGDVRVRPLNIFTWSASA